MTKVLAIFSLLFLLCGELTASGIEFFKGTFAEAQTLAADEGKIIFVDAYTTWCGPCKRMSKNVFPQDEVGAFYNDNFVNLKLDMEKGEGRTFQKKYRVSAFPTLLFLDPSGKVVHRVTGGMDAGRFIKLGQTAARKGDVSSHLDKDYEEGNRSPEFIAEYIKTRSKANKPVIKLANEYFKTKPDLNTPESQQILFYGAGEADSRIFNTMVADRDQMLKTFGEEAYNAQIEKACDATLKKGIKFSNLDLVEEAIDKHKRYHTIKNANYPYEARLQYFGAIDDAKNYLKHAKGYAKLGDAQRKSLCATVLKYLRHQPTLVKAGEGWATTVAKRSATVENLYVAAQFQHLNGNHEESLETANHALKLASESKSRGKKNIESLIRAISKSISEPKSN